MITVKFFVHQPYTCDTETKNFASLVDMANWIYSKARRKSDGAPDVFFMRNLEDELKRGRNWESDFVHFYEYDSFVGCIDFKIHMISDERGVLCSDGKYTNGRKHCGKDVIAFMKQASQGEFIPQFNFVD